MRKAIPITIQEKLNKIISNVGDTENTVPSIMKKTFNFKGRKSPLIAQKVMSALSDSNTSIFDPFAGGGSFIIASVRSRNRILATEIDNYIYNANKALLEFIDKNKLDKNYHIIENKCKNKVMNLYSTSCCGIKNYINKLLYDPENNEYFNPTQNREIKNGKNIILVEKCPICKCKSKKFEQADLDKIYSLDSINTSKFPHKKYIENSRINITASTGADYYDRIFTQRNKIALLTIQDAILDLPASKERDFLEQVLVSCLSLARIAMYGSSTDILYHVVPHGAQEMNVWTLFSQKFNNFLKFKEKFNDIQTNDITNNPNYTFINSDYKDYLDTHKDLIFDMIYTDFPYTDQVPYLERNQLFRIWLETFYDKKKYALTNQMLDKEIVQTNAPSRSKKQKIENYYHDINTMFATLYEHLKNNGLIVFTIKLGKEKYFKTYMEIINLARKNGFEYAFRMGIEKNDPTLRKQSAYANTFINEIIVVFYKLNSDYRYWYFGDENYEFLMIKKIYNYILDSKDNVTLSTAVKIIINDLKSRYSHVASNDDIIKIKKILEDNFIVYDGIIQIDSNRLYLDIEDTADLYTKLYDLIPIYIGNLLKKEGKFVLEDIYFELTNSLCDGNPNTISQILENPQHQNDIKNLINNYCDTSNGYYIEKKSIIKPSSTAIDISQLSGTDFELLVKRLLEKHGFLNVVQVGGAGDLGVDIMAAKLENKELKHYIFQCKRWVANVGSDPIQRLFAERSRRNLDYAVCITTSGYTKDGFNAAKDFNVKILDGRQVLDLLNNYFPGEYYNGAPV
ncbi:DUF2034 domain-containing protein [Clostridium tyrobutyricum]|uniref:restriction endonuclease n=1 Tax=Clostridium tyrobutyricum TaxID=1519 RepID=UPI0011CC7CB0|nr:restriction endonuclease [Clostridium tyrobutyricum]